MYFMYFFIFLECLGSDVRAFFIKGAYHGDNPPPYFFLSPHTTIYAAQIIANIIAHNPVVTAVPISPLSTILPVYNTKNSSKSIAITKYAFMIIFLLPCL